MGNIHAIEATNNEKNLCRLFLAVRKTGPVAIAFAEIYILLNKLAPGQTVREYCQDVLGYNGKIYGNVFNADERKKLAGPWDPKSQDVTFLYKLIFHICGLNADGQNWVDPAYPLEFNLLSVKNRRNDTMHSKSELTDAELQAIVQELEHSLIAALSLAGAKKGRDVSTQENSFKSKIQTYIRKERPWYYPFRVIADSIGIPYQSDGIASGSAGIASGSVGVASGSAGIASNSAGIASASAVSKSAGITDFGSFGAASASAGEFGHHASETKDQFGRDELMECLNEAEALEFHGISAIIRRQLNQ